LLGSCFLCGEKKAGEEKVGEEKVGEKKVGSWWRFQQENVQDATEQGKAATNPFNPSWTRSKHPIDYHYYDTNSYRLAHDRSSPASAVSPLFSSKALSSKIHVALSKLRMAD
jgi:hypothetical protein